MVRFVVHGEGDGVGAGSPPYTLQTGTRTVTCTPNLSANLTGTVRNRSATDLSVIYMVAITEDSVKGVLSKVHTRLHSVILCWVIKEMIQVYR